MKAKHGRNHSLGDPGQSVPRGAATSPELTREHVNETIERLLEEQKEASDRERKEQQEAMRQLQEEMRQTQEQLQELKQGKQVLWLMAQLVIPLVLFV